MAFENATPVYLAALEDKGLFGGGKRGSAKSQTTVPTVPAWVQFQATECVPTTLFRYTRHASGSTDDFASVTQLCAA